MSENTTYTRGTKTERRKTARLEPGDQVLTGFATASTSLVTDAQTKTHAVIRTVDRLEAQQTPAKGFHQRAGRQYTVHFTDGTRAEGLAPILTWHALAR